MITQTNKFKLFNDPIYGFIAIPSALVFDLIEHPTFQRLRRISQLGLSSLVYAGANHTRFHHALGSMHLMQRAIHVLQSKGHAISGTEAEAVFVAILLHDIGHGPFSHALENSLVDNVSHESISTMLMAKLNKDFGGKLDMAIDIFRDKHPQTFSPSADLLAARHGPAGLPQTGRLLHGCCGRGYQLRAVTCHAQCGKQ